MRYVAAYLLASLNEEGKPNKEKIISILDSVGIDVDDEKLSKVSENDRALSADDIILSLVMHACVLKTSFYFRYSPTGYV